MSHDTYNYDKDGVTNLLNRAKESFIKAMLSENIITQEIADQMLDYAFIVNRPSNFSTWVGDKLSATYYAVTGTVPDPDKQDPGVCMFVAKFSRHDTEFSNQDNTEASVGTEGRRLNLL